MQVTQADKLKELMKKERKVQRKNTKFIAVTSGKGGVGKSTISANIANILANDGYKVALFDADIGLANLDVILNVKIGKNLLHVLKGECKFAEIVKEVKPNLKLIPGDSGGEILKYNTSSNFNAFLEDSEFLSDLDFLIIDTGAGIAGTTLHFLEISDEVIVVTTPDPAAITDAYATIKVSSENRKNFLMIFNEVRNEREALDLYTNINKVASANINTKPELNYLGFLESSQNIINCIKSRVLFSSVSSRDTTNLKKIVNALLVRLERNMLKDMQANNFKTFFKKFIDRI